MGKAPLLAALLAAAAPGPKKIAVFDLEATGAPAELAAAASLLVPAEVRARNPGAQVISAADLRSMLGLEREKKMLGCEEGASCLAEIGGAMGVDQMVAGRLGRVGKTWVLEVRLTDVRKARVTGSAVRTVRGEEDALIGALRDAVGEIFAAGGTSPPGAAVPAPSAEGGRVLSGEVSEGGRPVPEVWVRAYEPETGAPVDSAQTGADGRYRLRLAPGAYRVQARGQQASVDLGGGDKVQSFTAAQGRITATVTDPEGKPLRRVKALLYPASGKPPVVSYEVSDAEGRVTLFTPEPGAKHLLELRLDRGQAAGSIVYQDRRQLRRGKPVTAPAAGQETSLGTIRLPPGAILTGLVTRNGQPTADAVVQVRVGGTGPRHHFVLTRTRRDGSYQLSLPAALTVKRLCAHAPRHPCPGSGRGSGQGPGYAFADDLVMGKPGSTATRNLGFEL